MAAVNSLSQELLKFTKEKYAGSENAAKDFFEKEVDSLVHEGVLKEGKRVDDRGLEEVRPLSAQVAMLPRTHGSGLFIRGETKTLSLLTLGAPGDQKLLEGMEFIGKKRFLHHYNFPPYAPGEVKPLRGPGRREIGHGMLAEKALLPVIPSFDEFPYTIRIVTEVLSSNGSTSMASCCSSSLALMDAGVPIKAPIAGISMGLMSEGKNWKLLTDIQGPEDHHGDMDFKIAGTQVGVTALQLDVKIRGINEEIFKQALVQAKKTREKIIKEVLLKTLEKPRAELSPLAPRVFSMDINPDKIGLLIGPGGKTINKITADYTVEIDIDDEAGKVFVTGENADLATKALQVIKDLVREVQVGEMYEGKVKRIMEFGAFVEFAGSHEGLVHISQLAPHRVNKVTDVVKIGDVIPIKVIEIDEQGRLNLSLKDAAKPRTSN
jgi:polyribonucleotide nucleotidyltransferase